MEAPSARRSRPADRAAIGLVRPGRRGRHRIATLRNAAQEWLYENPDRVSAATLRNYGAALAVLADYAEAHERGGLEHFTPALVRACEHHVMDPDRPGRAANWRGGEGRARMVGIAARKLAAWLEAQDVPVATFGRYKPVRIPERIQPRVQPHEYTAMESATMRRLLQPGVSRLLVARDMALLGLCADTRLRAFELAALHWSNIDPETGVVVVEQGKGRKPRLESVWDADERDGGSTMRALRAYRALWVEAVGEDKDGPLIVNYRLQRMDRDGIAVLLRRVSRDAGLDGNRPPHAFRRGSFSTQYQRNPLNLPALKQRMGWSEKSNEMVAVYTRGADMDLAANTPMVPTSKLWRQTVRDQPSPQRSPNAGKQNGNRGGW